MCVEDRRRLDLFVFFFNDTATTEIYTLSLHDALPICSGRPLVLTLHNALPERGGALRRVLRLAERATIRGADVVLAASGDLAENAWRQGARDVRVRSEEHTSELQSRQYLVCRLLLEKKKQN